MEVNFYDNNKSPLQRGWRRKIIRRGHESGGKHAADTLNPEHQSESCGWTWS